MTQTIWTLPVPSTALLHGCAFEILPRRASALRCQYENDSGDVVSLRLLFEGVQAFKCTYHEACTPEMIKTAYDKVVDMGATEWLGSVIGQLLSYGTQNIGELKHLMIYFDDGPCYEIVCRIFQVEETATEQDSRF